MTGPTIASTTGSTSGPASRSTSGPTTGSTTGLDGIRAVADAVLYEGYLLYPYRSTSAKNQVRWQFGVLGPPGAAAAWRGEEPDIGVQCLLAAPVPQGARLRIHLRFLQLQSREVEQADGVGGGSADGERADGEGAVSAGGESAGGAGPVTGEGAGIETLEGAFTPVGQLERDGRIWLSWSEATECELVLGPFDLIAGPVADETVTVPGGEDIELLSDTDGTVFGRVVRRRRPLRVRLTVARESSFQSDCEPARLSIEVTNTSAGRQPDRDAATALSLLGTHLILVVENASFVSVIDPPPEARTAAASCRQRRCWPVLAGVEPQADVMLASPIILYDYPQIAPESPGALFDGTEIDEILTLRVMTMTDEEKAQARATDPRAATIIDRCDQLTPADLQRLHGVLRDPHADPRTDALTGRHGELDPLAAEVPWWDPGTDSSVDPGTDAVLVQGVQVRRGSLVRLRPSRRADAQDLFFAGQAARVTAVLGDVDGDTHIAVVLLDDPAAEINEESGRFLYFAPDEVEPLSRESSS